MLFNERPVVLLVVSYVMLLCVFQFHGLTRREIKAVVVVVKAASCCSPVINTQSKSLGALAVGNNRSEHCSAHSISPGYYR